MKPHPHHRDQYFDYSGVIVTLRYGRDSEASLWYERKDSTLGFAPWPTCAPQPKAYQ